MRDRATQSGESRGRAFARSALLGNPSDGFGGATIAFTFAEFEATVAIGADGGATDPDALRLVEATAARFSREHGLGPDSSDGVRVSTTIPREVGLGGSSAIVTAAVRALCSRTGAALEPERTARMALAVELEDLGIAAGPKDRLVQAHEGLLHMDFSDGSARCTRLDPAGLPPLLVAWVADGADPSGVVHGDLRERFERDAGDTRPLLREIAALADHGREAIERADHEELGRLMDATLDLRSRLLELELRHLRMAELARSLGGSANYTGSGGAIVATVPRGASIEDLDAEYSRIGCRVRLVTPTPPAAASFSG